MDRRQCSHSDGDNLPGSLSIMADSSSYDIIRSYAAPGGQAPVFAQWRWLPCSLSIMADSSSYDIFPVQEPRWISIKILDSDS